jgi:hemoglobin
MTKIINKSFQMTALESFPLPSTRLYMLWGEEKIRQMVRYHHDLLQLGDIENFLPNDHDKFEHATQKTADFFVDVLSKGKFSTTTYSYPSLKMRYFQITVDEHARDVWLDAYKKAIIHMKMPSECIEDFWSWIEPLSLWMVNRRTLSEIPRYPYRDVWMDFVDFKQMHRCG